jgi:PAS domain-containing protein
MPISPDRLAQDLQRSLNELQQERERTQQLLAELERQNHELDRLRSSVHRESNSRLLAEEALDETRDRLQLAVEAAGLALWDWQLTSRSVFLTARWGELIGDVAMDAQWDLDKLHERVHPDDLCACGRRSAVCWMAPSSVRCSAPHPAL